MKQAHVILDSHCDFDKVWNLLASNAMLIGNLLLTFKYPKNGGRNFLRNVGFKSPVDNATVVFRGYWH
jgi:hypothetical protein